jgi:hypothetical protein
VTALHPGQPFKANQDALCVHTRFAGNEDEHVFGVGLLQVESSRPIA